LRVFDRANQRRRGKRFAQEDPFVREEDIARRGVEFVAAGEDHADVSAFPSDLFEHRERALRHDRRIDHGDPDFVAVTFEKFERLFSAAGQEHDVAISAQHPLAQIEELVLVVGNQYGGGCGGGSHAGSIPGCSGFAGGSRATQFI